jgi:hypothetical protein
MPARAVAGEGESIRDYQLSVGYAIRTRNFARLTTKSLRGTDAQVTYSATLCRQTTEEKLCFT